MKAYICIALLTLLSSVATLKKSYRDYNVYQVVPNTMEQVEALNQMKNSYEFWTDYVHLNGTVSIMVSPVNKEEFLDYLKNGGFAPKLTINDVQSFIDAQLIPASNEKENARLRSTGHFSWNEYQNLDTIYNWLDELPALFPNIVRTVSMGDSFEGREIKGVIINYHPESVYSNRPIGILEGGIHAREWISPSQVTWIINEFLTSSDPGIRSMAESIEWHIFPVTNPDGYAYTFESDRLWRKNRNTDYFQECGQWVDDDLSNGVDLNRNFDFLWMEIGASNNPCDQTFAGSAGFSEPEARAISNYVFAMQAQGNLVYFIAFHSYSQMIMVPFSHLEGAAVLEVPNYGDLYEIGMRAADKLRERHGTDYLVGTSANILYAVTGSSDDWVKGVAEVPLVFLYELRDIGAFGFLLPADQIIPNNEEVMDSLVEIHKVSQQLGYYYSHSNIITTSVITLLASVIIALCL